MLVWAVGAWADGQSVLSWSANTESDLAGYKVYRSTVAGSYGAPLAVIGKVTTYTDTVKNQTAVQYYYTVTAYDTAGNESPKSNEVTKLIPGTPDPPQAPSGRVQ